MTLFAVASTAVALCTIQGDVQNIHKSKVLRETALDIKQEGELKSHHVEQNCHDQ